MFDKLENIEIQIWIQAYKVNDYFAIHAVVGSDMGATLTHIPTGRRISLGLEEHELLPFVDKLMETGIDWSSSDHTAFASHSGSVMKLYKDVVANRLPVV